MDTTPAPTATAIDRQAGPDARTAPTCDCTPCRRKARRAAQKAALRAAGQHPKENAQYVDDQLIVPWRRAALRIANGGNVEELALLADALRAAEAQLGEAVRMMRAADPEGASWQRVADALGVKKQSAWERFGQAK